MRKLILLFAMLFAMQSFTNAQYCIPTGGLACGFSDQITNVLFGTINNTSGTVCTTGYANFPVTPTTTTNVTQGLTYPISLALQSGGGTEHAGVWIDYNANGTFEATEFKYLGTISTSTSAATLVSSITIPVTATPGLTRMRIRLRFGTAVAATENCTGLGFFGEVEDYTINIQASAPCAGTPNPGITSSTAPANTICAALPYTLNVQNTTGGAGVTYQWQSSTTGALGSYINISGATSATLAVASATITTWYQLNVTCATGPATGTSVPVKVTVNPKPVVTVSPITSCGSPANTLTAAGADTYTWTPALGLSATVGASVTSNPAANTVYTVTGTTTATGCINTATATVNSAPISSVLSSPVAFVYQINEGFEVAPIGWSSTNLSNPIGTITGWGLSTVTTGAGPAYDGTGFAVVNFNSGAGTSELSNWLVSPVIASVKNGDVFSFWTKAATGGGAFPDRLEARLSTAGASTNIGTTSSSVGDFTTLLQSVNPGLTSTGYPEVWTKYTVTISGLAAPTSGRVAFRYWVTNGGPTGANSNVISLDRVQWGTPPAAVCTNTVSNLAIAITGGTPPYTVVYNDGTNNITYASYLSGGTINVTPSVTTTYSVVSVTSANGCVGSGNSGVVTVAVTPPAAINIQPAASVNACIGGNANISVTPNTLQGTTYQWQINTVPSPGAPVWNNLTNAVPYAGVTTNILSISGATTAMDMYQYRVLVTGACGGNITSTASTLSVNAPAVITTQPATTLVLCVANNGTLTVAATGNLLSYVWEVSTNAGTSWAAVAGANYAGQGTNTLTLVNVPATFLNYQYRVRVSSGGCTSTNSTVSTVTAVNPTPVVTISASPVTSLFPGLTSTLTAAVSPNPGVTYQWIKDNAFVTAPLPSNKYVVTVDGFGYYSVKVVDDKGCTNNFTTPANIQIKDSATNNILFVYPSPNSGKFQVRYYFDSKNGNTTPATFVNIYDEKGARVFTRGFAPGLGYGQMNVDLGAHGRGIYRVDLLDGNGNRLKTGSVMVF
jgi:hypothetical protein